jgi:hypothetical protein
MLRKLHVRFGERLLIILRDSVADSTLPTGEPVREFESHRFRQETKKPPSGGFLLPG